MFPKYIVIFYTDNPKENEILEKYNTIQDLILGIWSYREEELFYEVYLHQSNIRHINESLNLFSDIPKNSEENILAIIKTHNEDIEQIIINYARIKLNDELLKEFLTKVKKHEEIINKLQIDLQEYRDLKDRFDKLKT